MTAAATAPSKIIIHIILFICLLRRHLLLLVVVVAILDHFITHYRTVAIDRHTIVISSPSAANLIIGLVEEALPMNIWWRRAIATLHQRWQLFGTSRTTNLATLGSTYSTRGSNRIRIIARIKIFLLRRRRAAAMPSI